MFAAQRAEDELHGVEACQVPTVATERPLEEMDAVFDRIKRALEVAVLVQAHRRQDQRVAVRYLVALEQLVRVSGQGQGQDWGQVSHALLDTEVRRLT